MDSKKKNSNEILDFIKKQVKEHDLHSKFEKMMGPMDVSNSTVDLSKPKRRYYSNECELTICPECGARLVEESCSIVLCVKAKDDNGEFVTNISGSHFCLRCPVVVFDVDKLEQAAILSFRGDEVDRC